MKGNYFFYIWNYICFLEGVKENPVKPKKGLLSWHLFDGRLPKFRMNLLCPSCAGRDLALDYLPAGVIYELRLENTRSILTIA
jgi:hypothetical protein